MTRIGLLGDTHSNFPWIHYAIDAFDRFGINTVIQVGDLGIWPGKSYTRAWDEVQSHLVAKDQLWLVAPGNHEDYDQIEGIPIDEETGWKPFRDNIALLPRGARWEMGKLSFVALGGANSVDRGYRQTMSRDKNRPPTWWAQESITQEDVDNVAAGGYADVMIAHDAPNGVDTISRRIHGNPFGFDPIDILYANDGRAMMDQAFRAVAPKLFIHGHYHFPVDEKVHVNRDGELGECHIFGLNKDEENFSFGELDIDTGEAKFIDIRKDHAMHRWVGPPRSWARYGVDPEQ